MPVKLLRQDFLGGLGIIAVGAIAFWLARDLPAGNGGGMGPGTLPKGLALLLGGLGVADDEATRRRLLDLGSVIPDKAGRSPQALQKLVESEVARWTPILKAAQGQEGVRI